VTKCIHEEAVRRAFENIVYVSKDLPSHATRLPVQRECKSESYTWFEDDEPLKGIVLYTRENAIIQQNLCRLIPPFDLQEGHVVVMHTFVNEHLLRQECFAHLASGDFLVFPYEPTEYLYRASHRLLEALSMARPVVVSSDTWLEREIYSYSEPVGTVMREWNAEGLALAMSAARRNTEAFQSSAEAAAPLVRERYEHTKFFDEFVLS
jgi:glycosyltransferase involved in cell wall biosynthesis